MRVLRLTINGFRAWARTERFDLDADAVIVVAPNGQGKTSLFDAILWCLTGSVPRIGSDVDILSKYNESGQASVAIDLQNGETSCRISRLSDGTTQKLQIELDGRSLTGSAAQSQVLETLWPAALSASKPEQALVSAFTNSVYLQQDLVRDFIQNEDDQTRYHAISEIIGTGRVTELQAQLDLAKTAWTKATNNRYEESAESRHRLRFLEDQLQSLESSQVDLKGLQNHWTKWWKQVARFMKQEPEVRVSSTRAGSSLDRALKELQSRQLAVGRQSDMLTELSRFASARPSHQKAANTEAAIRETLSALSSRIDSLYGTMEQLAADKRKADEAEKERAKTISEQIELATLALRQLGSQCPVCQQNYDKAKTQRYLQNIIVKSGLPKQRKVSSSESLSTYSAELAELERQRSEANLALRGVTAADEERRLWETELGRRLNAAKIPSDADLAAELQKRSTSLRDEATAIAALLDAGEALALQLSAASEAQRRVEVIREIEAVKEQVRKAESDRSERVKTGELASKVLDALRGAAFDLVVEQLGEIEPLLQQIYETADPHPAFKVVRLVSNLYRGRGRLGTEIADPERKEVRSIAPGSILSSSQLNVLAVSLFLAINLSVKDLPLSCAILDDPLQSLDDLNLLGLVDVLRQVKDRRQLLISTHDDRFGGLLERKLRPVHEEQRTRIIELSGWSRSGPIVHQHDALRDVSGKGQRSVFAR